MEKMKKLVTVTSETIIDDLRNVPDIVLVYPLKSFCVGYPLEFAADKVDGLVLVNRILDDNDLDELDCILKNNDFKGIVFDDLGIIDLVKDKDMQKILLLDHLATNTESINYYLEYVDSVVVSNDLTKDEIVNIVSNANKPLVVNVFGLKTLMYSRRLLLSNYQEYYKLNKVITENINYYLKDNTDNYYFLYIDYKDYEYKEYISIVLYISYFTGGAHPNYEIKTINYNKNTNKFIDIDDLINRDKDILNKLSIYSREYFSNNDMFNDKVVFDMMIDGTKSIKDNYKYFNITSDGLIIYFNRYQIAPYYYGDYSITIPYNYLDLSI